MLNLITKVAWFYSKTKYRNFFEKSYKKHLHFHSMSGIIKTVKKGKQITGGQKYGRKSIWINKKTSRSNF